MAKFINVIENAKMVCEQSKFMIDDHFIQVGKMIEIAKDAKIRRNKLVIIRNQWSC